MNRRTGAMPDLHRRRSDGRERLQDRERPRRPLGPHRRAARPSPRCALERLPTCGIACRTWAFEGRSSFQRRMLADMNSLDLAVIGNCMISALVDRRAQIVWSCFPRFDGDPVFSALLDSPDGRTDADQQGRLRHRHGRHGDAASRAISRTPRCCSRRMTDSFGNILEITDFAPRFKHFDRIFRPPMLVRRVRAGQGPAAHPRAPAAALRLGRAAARRSRAAATICASSAPTSRCA